MITVDKTMFFPIDGKQISVSELPMPVRKQFDLLDAFRQEQYDAGVKLQMANIAVQVKTLELHEIVRKIVSPAEPVAPAAPASEGEATPDNA